MRANSPSAFFASLALHAALAVAIFLLTIIVVNQPVEPPVIFELVAGPSTHPDELKAPAKGNNSLKVDIPKVVLPKEPEPRPVEPTPVEKPVPEKPVEKPKVEPKKVVPKNEPKQVSYEEFKKKNPLPEKAKPAKPRPIKAPQVDVAGIAKGVTGGAPTSKGGGGGKALSREEADAMRVYEALLKNRLREAHDRVKPEGLGDLLSAEVTFFVAANGQIDNVRIARSSGNAAFDASVLEAFRRIAWPGARPDKKNDTWRLTFRMREE
ncbi:MAG: TonB family protein [Candidatus Didemnitutus sp.]|nr:TonB family protein [Candidatus Didemnitutus sp.]